MCTNRFESIAFQLPLVRASSVHRVLRIHIDKLSRLITPAHPLLRIPHEYRVEAPWPFAQQQIAYISAYKTPREKVQCVVRCITSIMNLLQMASSRSPAADDLVPVLIFVVIKVSAGQPVIVFVLSICTCH